MNITIIAARSLVTKNTYANELYCGALAIGKKKLI